MLCSDLAKVVTVVLGYAFTILVHAGALMRLSSTHLQRLSQRSKIVVSVTAFSSLWHSFLSLSFHSSWMESVIHSELTSYAGSSAMQPSIELQCPNRVYVCT